MAGEPQRAVDERHGVEHRDRLGDAPGRLARQAQQHRRAHLLFEQHGAVGRHAVLVEGLAMVGDDDERGPVEQPARGQAVEHLADVQVDVGERVVEAVLHHRDLVQRVGEEGGREVERRGLVGRRPALGHHVGVVRRLEVQVDRERARRLAVEPLEEGRRPAPARRPSTPRRRPAAARRASRASDGRARARASVERDHVAPALVLAGEERGAVAERVERIPEQRARVVEPGEVVVPRILARMQRGEDRGLRVVGVRRSRVGAVEDDRLARQLEQSRRRLRSRLRP